MYHVLPANLLLCNYWNAKLVTLLVWTTIEQLRCHMLSQKYGTYLLVILWVKIKRVNFNLALRSVLQTDSTFVLKRTVDCYRRNGSHTFARFINFNKAFVIVDYLLLFCNLCVWLLTDWYSHQLTCVRWQGVMSTCFSTGNGVRQGGILSPFLSRFYIWDLSET